MIKSPSGITEINRFFGGKKVPFNLFQALQVPFKTQHFTTRVNDHVK